MNIVLKLRVLPRNKARINREDWRQGFLQHYFLIDRLCLGMHLLPGQSFFASANGLLYDSSLRSRRMMRRTTSMVRPLFCR